MTLRLQLTIALSVALSTQAAVSTMPDPMPLFTVPPPNTNRYFLHLFWDTNCGTGAVFAWGTNGAFQNTNIFFGGECRISNLVYGASYGFRSTTNCSNITVMPFPPVQPAWTNFVSITCTGLLWRSEGWKGVRFDYTNRLFAMDQQKDYFFYTVKPAPIQITVLSNNQVKYSQLIGRQ